MVSHVISEAGKDYLQLKQFLMGQDQMEQIEFMSDQKQIVRLINVAMLAIEDNNEIMLNFLLKNSEPLRIEMASNSDYIADSVNKGSIKIVDILI